MSRGVYKSNNLDEYLANIIHPAGVTTQEIALFKKNAKNMFGANKRLLSSIGHILEGRSRYVSRTIEQEYDYWLKTKHKSLVLPQLLPRDKQRYAHYHGLSAHFNIGGGIDQYKDLASEDPHLLGFLCKLYDVALDLGIDIKASSTISAKPTNTLISIGLGSGKFFLHSLNSLEPFNVSVIFSEWTEIVSSFYYIDWSKLYEQYEDRNKRLTLERVQGKNQLLGCLLKLGLCTSDLAQIITYDSCQTELVKQMTELNEENVIQNTVVYTGFTVDEYNMMINSVQTLALAPKVYTAPRQDVGGDAIVCGSGPSLDESIDIIQAAANKVTIIAGGSNYRTLRRHNIRVDYLVLNERSPETYTDYKQVIEEYGRDECCLVMSCTCPSGLLSLFPKSCVYFRPVLTPLALFGSDPSEVLYNEGPESVNCAMSFAYSLGFMNIYMFGIDLGAVNSSSLRSAAACGATPRVMDLIAPGNLIPTVLTSRSLLDTKHVIERLITPSNKEVFIYNCSNGVLIQGATPMRLDDFAEHLASIEARSFAAATQNQYDWFSKLYSYNRERLTSCWLTRVPRRSIFRFSSELKDIFQNTSDYPTFPILLRLVDQYTSLNVSPRDQFPRRLWRSTIIKCVLAFSQQLHTMKKVDLGLDYPTAQIFEEQARFLLADLSDKLRDEGMALCDMIDKLIHANTASCD